MIGAYIVDEQVPLAMSQASSLSQVCNYII
jgi:hypothetical protein